MNRYGFRLAAGIMALWLLQGTAAGTVFAGATEGTNPPAEQTADSIAASGLRVALADGGEQGRYSDYASDAIPKAITQTSPSVVAIIGKPKDTGGESDRFDLAHGTGVVVRQNGVIITNAHVVKDMDHIVVVTYDGKQYNGKTTHMDEESDLALVQIEAAGLKEAVFASKADTKVGETVIAIGTPISFSLRNSVTVGVISGLDRSVNSTYRLLQTDAAINPGNSGGALVNLKGEVVGINTLKYADYGIDNLGFAIPADTVNYVLKHLLTYGKVKRPYVGSEFEESWAAVVGLPSGDPLTFGYVEPGSPADKAGLKEGDKLLTVGGTPVKTLVEFNELLKQYLPGDSAVFSVQSGGQTVSHTVVFGETPDNGVKKAQSGSPDGAGIDSDEGKTRIGDSHYGWSMKYPSGMVKVYQSSGGNSVTFADAKDEFALVVDVEGKKSDYSKGALLKLLADKMKEDLVLDRRTVTAGNTSYARVIGRSDNGYMESRAYLRGGYIYYLHLTVREERDYQNPVKRKGFTDLLDSFAFSFNKNDPALKDIAVDKDGYHKYTNEDYGYSLSVPSDWTVRNEEGLPVYTDRKSNRQVIVEMSSLAKGDSIPAWVERQEKWLADSYVPEYFKAGDVKDTFVAGQEAKEWTVSASLGDKWETIRSFFFEKDGYKYRLQIGYPKDTPSDEAEQLASRVKASFKWVAEGRNKALGYIEDEDDLVDRESVVTINNKTHGYSVKIPELWTLSGLNPGYDFDSESDYDEAGKAEDRLSYHFLGGSFTITADNESSLEDTVKDLEEFHKKNKETDSKYDIQESDESILGTEAKKFVLHYKSRNIPYESTEYVFSKGDTVFIVSMRIDDAVKTDGNLKLLQDAFESIRFKEE